MPVFLNYFVKLSPLYFNIFLGYIAGKKIKANQDTIAKLVFYIISPLIIFNGVLKTHLDRQVLTLPFLTFFISCFLCIIFYRISRRIWKDSSKNLMAFSAGSGATGYFGIPLAMILFNDQVEGVYIMALLGVSFYDNSLGYYITAKGSCTTKECFSKLLSLPTLYAFLIGLLLNVYHVSLPSIYEEFIGHIKGVYVVLGTMIIGLSLSSLKTFKLDPKFVGMTFLAKFLVWPLIIFAVIAIDERLFNVYDTVTHQVLILISIVPLAVNMVIMASLIEYEPEKAAATVLLSALFALIYIPLMTLLFINP